MNKPTFPIIVFYSPAEIKAIRKAYKYHGKPMTQDQFGRFFPVTGNTIRSWESESTKRQPYGPCGARLQELKAYADYLAEGKENALNKIMNRKVMSHAK